MPILALPISRFSRTNQRGPQKGCAFCEKVGGLLADWEIDFRRGDGQIARAFTDR